MVDWRTQPGLSHYPLTHAAMNEGRTGKAIWLLKRPPLYAAVSGYDTTSISIPLVSTK